MAELTPTAANAVSTGRARKLSQSIWNEVTIGDVTGWANSTYLGFMGITDDATAEFLDGAIPPETAVVRTQPQRPRRPRAATA